MYRNIAMRIKFELEYTINSSPKVMFSRLSTPEGLSEWFSDDATVSGDVFTFRWGKSEASARLVSIKENKLVKFEWMNEGYEESNFFEFRINVEELTGDVALIITDFAEPEEKEDSIYLWDSQITELKRLLGN
jgi:uncharacterized protein YndB with AHSA1/START domain